MGHRRPGHRDGQQEQRHGEAGRRMGSKPLGATAEADQPGPAAGETGQGEDRGGDQRHGRHSNPSTRALIRGALLALGGGLPSCHGPSEAPIATSSA